MHTLYELKNNYLQIFNNIEDNEIDDLSLTEIKNIEDEINTKAVNIASMIKNMEHKALGVKNIIESLQSRYKKINNKIDFLNNYLLDNLQACDVNEIKADYFNIKIRINPPSVCVNDEDIIPDEYFDIKTTRLINKKKILADIKNNININGVELINKKRIEIK